MQDLHQSLTEGGLQHEVHHGADDKMFLRWSRQRQQQHLHQLFGSQEAKNVQLQTRQKVKMSVESESTRWNTQQSAAPRLPLRSFR